MCFNLSSFPVLLQTGCDCVTLCVAGGIRMDNGGLCPLVSHVDRNA